MANTLDHAYSTFEQATALALWWFAQQRPDIAIRLVLRRRWIEPDGASSKAAVAAS